MTIFYVSLILFAAVFTQSVTGFGSALVAMSLLPHLVGIRIAAPFVALATLLMEILLITYYRHALRWRAIWRISLASFLGIPLGVFLLSHIDERILLTILGMLLIGYAIYGLLDQKIPQIKHQLWGYSAGFLAGILGGAYNTSGPPVIIYAHSQNWKPAEFKGNLQGFFLLVSAFVTISHGLSGNLTPAVWQYFLYSLPAIGIGMWIGLRLDKVIKPENFRSIVLCVLLLLGIRLIV